MSNYPGSQDDSSTLPNPIAGNFTTAPDHAVLHSTENDAIKALEAKLGIGASTATSGTLLRGTGAGTTAFAQANLATDVTGTLPVVNGGTGITSLGTGVATFLGTPTSANLSSTVTDETGSGSLVFSSSPTIVTPTIANFTNAQHTHANAAAGGQITSSGLATGSVTQSQLDTSAGGIGGAWQSWSPIFTNWVIGTGGSAGTIANYVQIGKIVHFYVLSIMGTSGASVSGAVSFTMPVTASTNVLNGISLGPARLLSGGTAFLGTAITFSASKVLVTVTGVSATYAVELNLNSTVPGTWGSSGDYIKVSGTYEAA